MSRLSVLSNWRCLAPAAALLLPPCCYCLLPTHSYDISTIASVIPAFASRQDLLVIDEGVSYPIQQVCCVWVCVWVGGRLAKH